jgi:hypothetical protein
MRKPVSLAELSVQSNSRVVPFPTTLKLLGALGAAGTVGGCVVGVAVDVGGGSGVSVGGRTVVGVAMMMIGVVVIMIGVELADNVGV